MKKFFSALIISFVLIMLSNSFAETLTIKYDETPVQLGINDTRVIYMLPKDSEVELISSLNSMIKINYKTNENSNVEGYITKSSTVELSKQTGQTILDICSQSVKWLYNYNFTYKSTSRTVPLYAKGTNYGAPNSTGRYIDCSTFVSWMIYEEGNQFNKPELTKLGNKYPTALYSFGKYLLNHNTQKTNGAEKYMDCIYMSPEPSKYGISHYYSIEEIHEIIKPGDILVFNPLWNAGSSMTTHRHTNIFAGWVDSLNLKSKGVYVYDCGSAPSSHKEYASGSPLKHVYSLNRSSSHGFWDLVTILRIHD